MIAVDSVSRYTRRARIRTAIAEHRANHGYEIPKLGDLLARILATEDHVGANRINTHC